MEQLNYDRYLINTLYNAINFRRYDDGFIVILVPQEYGKSIDPKTSELYTFWKKFVPEKSIEFIQIEIEKSNRSNSLHCRKLSNYLTKYKESIEKNFYVSDYFKKKYAIDQYLDEMITYKCHLMIIKVNDDIILSDNDKIAAKSPGKKASLYKDSISNINTEWIPINKSEERQEDSVTELSEEKDEEIYDEESEEDEPPKKMKKK